MENLECKNQIEAEKNEYEQKVRAVLAEIGCDKESIERNIQTRERLKDVEKFLSELPEDSFGDQTEPFSLYFKDILESKNGEKAREFLKEKFSGKWVVDLGCGTTDNTLMVIAQFGIAGYIGVDKYNIENSDLSSKHLEEKYKLRAIFIDDDMLHFVASLPENSVNFIMNGIDDTVIRDGNYIRRLKKEIQRTTENNGILCGYNSVIRQPKNFKNIGIPEVQRHALSRDFFIEEKNQEEK